MKKQRRFRVNKHQIRRKIKEFGEQRRFEFNKKKKLTPIEKRRTRRKKASKSMNQTSNSKQHASNSSKKIQTLLQSLLQQKQKIFLHYLSFEVRAECLQP
mgnify:CR=1 FL=1